MLRTRYFKFTNSMFILISIFTWCHCQRRVRISKDFSVERDTESDDIIVDYQPSLTGSGVVEYSYDFDFESAVISGLIPNSSVSDNNRTSSNSDPSSSPGCPEPFEGRPWIIYGKPRRCYLSGYQWPCPQNMKLLPQRSSIYGYCACNCSADSYNGQTVTSPQSYCLGYTSDGRERILAYRKSWNGCFPLFEQGKCPDGEWLVLGTDSPLRGTFCKRRRCPNVALENPGNDTLTFYDYQRKSCHKVGDKCNSTNTHLKGKDTYYELTDGDWIPACRLGIRLRALSHRIGVSEIQCQKGQRLSRILGNCVPFQNAGRTNGGGIG